MRLTPTEDNHAYSPNRPDPHRRPAPLESLTPEEMERTFGAGKQNQARLGIEALEEPRDGGLSRIDATGNCTPATNQVTQIAAAGKTLFVLFADNPGLA